MATSVNPKYQDLEKYEDIKKLKQEIEKKTGKTPEQLYDEKEKRLKDATELREPDRVPFGLAPGSFSLRYAGVPQSVEFYEPHVYAQAVVKTALDFDPDACRANVNARSGLALEVLGAKQQRWPGGDLPPDVPHQAMDSEENMKAEEYDLLITDPIDFMLRYYLPRNFEALEALSKLPRSVDGYSGVGLATLFATPEFQKMAQAFLKAGQEQQKSQGKGDVISDLGFPSHFYPGGICFGVPAIPFEWIGDLRSMTGIMIDIYKRPEKIIAACERVLEWHLARALPADPTKRGHPRRTRGGITHFSLDNCISRKQFETFVWPTWKRALLATINLGFVPWICISGKPDNRWEYFLELPKGKFIMNFQQGDMTQAKEILGNHCCIMGNVPWGMLEFGSPQEVEEHCKNLIKVCGKGGGYILDSGYILADAKPANVKAMADSVKKYGRY